MPWRRKPASHLQYWSGPLSKTKTGGSKSISVFCCGPPELPKNEIIVAAITGRQHLLIVIGRFVSLPRRRCISVHRFRTPNRKRCIQTLANFNTEKGSKTDCALEILKRERVACHEAYEGCNLSNDSGGGMVIRTIATRRPAATFKEVTRFAAKQAEHAAKITTDTFNRKYVYDEDDVDGLIRRQLEYAFPRHSTGRYDFS